MKNFFVLTTFLFSALIGLISSNSFEAKFESEEIPGQNNFRELRNSEAEFFALAEANEMFGEDIISDNRNSVFEKAAEEFSLK